MHNEEKLWLVLPAAGSGSRMQEVLPKQYLSLHGLTIIEHTINLFLAEPKIEQLMVCVAQDDTHFNTLDISEHPRVTVTQGGESRAQSVLNGLEAISANDQDWVLVHDAARPCLSLRVLKSFIQEVIGDEVGGVLAVPATDTLKQARSNQRIESTLNRSTIWQAQTPQMFRCGLLKEALSHAINHGVEITDEASAMEASGYQPLLVRGDKRNIKITTPDDLALAEFLLSS